MLKSKHIDKICIAAMAAAILLTTAMLFGESLGIRRASAEPEYADRLLDGSRVHQIDIQIEDWEAFLKEAEKEEYAVCSAVIDGERFRQIGIRTKGNNSLHLTKEYGAARYSLKLEFDHYVDGGNYHGLDKLSLDASFQDNSYMKTFLTYDMMAFMGVPTPLCSYTWVRVNGEDWGLFLAVEEPEEAFARRNFGRNHGQLYKPDYLSLDDENSDVALRYTGSDPDRYENIFRNAKFEIDAGDTRRVIDALRKLSEKEDLESCLDVDEILRYFTVQVFVMNWDSYLGYTGHNYYLYEEGGKLSILPWDYNLAFGTYSLGMPEPEEDSEVLINYPIDTPAPGSVMTERPLYHHLMEQEEYFSRYHRYFEQLIEDYFESGWFEKKLEETVEMISPYVKADPTAFCSQEDFYLAADTLRQVCLLRAQSVRKQLRGILPSTFAEQEEFSGNYVDASSVDLYDLGTFEDLESAPKLSEVFS